MFVHLTRELARAERLETEVSLLVMDLDGFKEINDTHGHHVGDKALREVARVLRNGIRPYDICVRYAGDEFVVVLSGCGAQRGRAEAARAAAGDRGHPVRGPARTDGAARQLVRLSVFPHDGQAYETLLSTADQRMYQDKAQRKARAACGRRSQATDPTPSGRRCLLRSRDSPRPIARTDHGALRREAVRQALPAPTCRCPDRHDRRRVRRRPPPRSVLLRLRLDGAVLVPAGQAALIGAHGSGDASARTRSPSARPKPRATAVSSS